MIGSPGAVRSGFSRPSRVGPRELKCATPPDTGVGVEALMRLCVHDGVAVAVGLAVLVAVGVMPAARVGVGVGRASQGHVRRVV